MDKFLEKFVNLIVNPTIILLFAIALVVFIVGIIRFIAKSDSDDGRQTGSRHILWGLIGMAIMVSAFGIIRLILGTIGADTPDILPF